MSRCRLGRSFNDMTAMIGGIIQAKERLLLDVNHELCSPITRMKLRLEFHKDRNLGEGMNEDLRQMECMVTEILETAKINNNPGIFLFSVLDMKALVQNVTSGRYGLGMYLCKKIVTLHKGEIPVAGDAGYRVSLVFDLNSAAG